MSAGVSKWLAAIAIAFAAACATASPPIQVYGSARDLQRLVGEWRGEYIGDREHGRSGEIDFTLVAGEDHAHGDVLMTPGGGLDPYQRGEPGTQPHDVAPVTRGLSIRFVEAVDGTVTGVLDSYWDPDRKTQATATFVGRVGENTIEGTFTTKYASGLASTGGRWKAVRSR